MYSVGSISTTAGWLAHPRRIPRGEDHRYPTSVFVVDLKEEQSLYSMPKRVGGEFIWLNPLSIAGEHFVSIIGRDTRHPCWRAEVSVPDDLIRPLRQVIISSDDQAMSHGILQSGEKERRPNII